MAGESGPKVRTLSCPGCGGPLTVRGLLQTESIGCPACGSVIDLTDENLQIISTFQARFRHDPRIPLGSRGELFGELLEVIGYMRRKVTVEGVDYEWCEYLLFNPYKGFRWLSEYNGHWTFLRPMLERPTQTSSGPRHLDRQFQHFQTAVAFVTYVVGEFTWRVQVGESARVEDYIAPPYILSRELTGNEVVWSLGQYIEPRFLAQAFGLKTSLPGRVGVFSCQPSPFTAKAPRLYSLLLRFVVTALAIQLLFSLFSADKLVYKGNFSFRPSAEEKSFVTDVFDVSGRTSNVVLKTTANLSNSWLYLNLALIDEATGNAYDFGREISYYFGRDSDGAWTEGSQTDEATLPSVPAGRYYLRIEPENAGDPVDYSIQVYRDVPRRSFLVIALVLLLAMPAIVVWRSRAFEVARWSESDHPMWKLSDLSDD
jgi:uncharacterized protein DUF4178